jgi:hypothetical protein
MEDSVAVRAMKSAECYYKKKGWTVKNVAALGGEHAGCDLFLERDSERLKIEVKGSAKPYYGIPDLFGTEVNKHKMLIADFLCVVYLPPGKPEKLAIIPRDRIPPDCLKAKVSYRICNKFKSTESIREFLDEKKGRRPPKKHRAIKG